MDPPRADCDQVFLRVVSQLESIDRRLSELERHAVILFGHAGEKGRLALMSEQLHCQDRRILDLEALKMKLVGAVMLAGSMTGIILFIIDKLLDH